MTRKRRAPGTGSICQRSRDGMWVATFDLGGTPRRRKSYYAKTKEALLARLDEMGIDMSQPDEPPSRKTNMGLARAMGTHTEAEWIEICRATQECRYCEVQLTIFNDAKDHIIPVSQGGSDGPENLQRICWLCNIRRGTLPADEYVHDGEKPGEFLPKPTMRRSYEQVAARKAAKRQRYWEHLPAR